jgi:hypothetical protein
LLTQHQLLQLQLYSLSTHSVKVPEEALIEVYKKLRPGDPPSVSGGRSLLESRFFDEKRVDLQVCKPPTRCKRCSARTADNSPPWRPLPPR